MNILVLSIGVLLMAMSAVHCNALRRRLSKFNQWVINGGALEASVFCGLCGLLVAVLTFPWSY